MNNNYQFWFRMNNSGTRSSTGESSKRSLAGPAVANGSLGPLEPMFQSVCKFSSSSFREICHLCSQNKVLRKTWRSEGDSRCYTLTLRFRNGECTGYGARRTRSLRSQERTHHPSCWARHLESWLRYRSLC